MKEFIRENSELPGIPSVCEAVHIARDVLLAEESRGAIIMFVISARRSL